MKIEKSINIKHNLSMPKKVLKFILITIISLCILPTEGVVAQTAQPSSSCDMAYSECVLACNSDNACIKKCEEQKQICVDSLTVGTVQSMECRGIANPLCLATSAIGLASNGLYSGLESFLNISPTIFQSGDIADLIKEGVEGYIATNSANLLEKLSDNYIMDLMKSGKLVTFGPERILSYIYAKETEIKIIRIIMVGKLNNITEEVIRERLRDIYV